MFGKNCLKTALYAPPVSVVGVSRVTLQNYILPGTSPCSAKFRTLNGRGTSSDFGRWWSETSVARNEFSKSLFVDFCFAGKSEYSLDLVKTPTQNCTFLEIAFRCRNLSPDDRKMVIIDLTGETEEYFPWDELPPELKCEIAFGGELDYFDIVCLAITSKRNLWDVLGGTVDATGMHMLPYDEMQLHKTLGDDHEILEKLEYAIERDWGGFAAMLLGIAIDNGDIDDKNPKKDLKIERIIDDVVAAKAWQVFLRISQAGLLEDRFIPSSLLTNVDNFDVWRCVLDNHPIKWSRSSSDCPWDWAAPWQIVFMVGHPNFPKFGETPLKRVLEVVADDDAPARKKRKALDTSKLVDKFGFDADPSEYFPRNIIMIE